MGGFFDFFNTHRNGIFVCLFCLLALLLTLNWLSWLFAWGRFKEPKQSVRGQHLRYIFSDAIVKIINDFRHLLALVIVFIFAFVLVYSMIRAGSNIETMKESIQVVVASLGGLVGSIIGYYFGESAIAKASEGKAVPSKPNDVDKENDPVRAPVQAPTGVGSQDLIPPIEEAPPPPQSSSSVTNE